MFLRKRNLKERLLHYVGDSFDQVLCPERLEDGDFYRENLKRRVVRQSLTVLNGIDDEEEEIVEFIF